MTGPLVPLDPFLLSTVWGGDALQRRYGKRFPAEAPLGESWEASGIAGRDALVPSDGVSLADLFRADPEAFLEGARPDDAFPLLIKLISTSRLLSVQ
ncbi:MAG TPA: hypothetical protein VEI02_11130, partial [Planctomycetota bacterium]|nr:hypothetical protein [Planctomycetota bacterium]